jgi:hypothetical protein
MLRTRLTRFAGTCVVMVPLGLTVGTVSAHVVSAHCVAEQEEAMYGSGYSLVEMPTSVYSYSETGPGQIGWATAATATVGISSTVSISAEAQIPLVASVTATAGITVSGEASRTQTWTYTLDVPAGHTEFAQIWHEGLQVKAGLYTSTAACTDSWSNIVTAWLPVQSTSAGTYNISLVSGHGPAKTFPKW